MFWGDKQKLIPIGEMEFQIGVYVWIDRSWKEHPFLTNKFLIKTEAELQQLKEIGAENVYWVPEKSKLKPLAPVTQTTEIRQTNETRQTPNAEAPTSTSLSASVAHKNEQMAAQRRLMAKADREWEKSAALVRESLLSLRDNPKQNGIKLKALSEEIANDIHSKETLLMLLKEKSSQGLYHHALNCMSMSVLLAKYLQLPESVVSEIALGAIAHDVGQTMIRKHILEATTRTKVEESIFRDHCRLGVDIATTSSAFSTIAKSIIADHHEYFDGSGYPAGKKGEEISLPARIFSIVDRYETLCGSVNKEGKTLLPVDVLRLMWQAEKDRFDPAILAAFIKLLGVYPPGSIVSLSDGSIGLVISPGESSLHPKMLICDTKVTKDEAEIIDLQPGGQLEIEASVHPKNLSREIVKWLNMGNKLTLYFATTN